MEGLEYSRQIGDVVDPKADTEVEKTVNLRKRKSDSESNGDENVDPHAETAIVDIKENESGSNPDSAPEIKLNFKKDDILETTTNPQKFIEQLSSFLSTISEKKIENRQERLRDAELHFTEKILELLRSFNVKEMPSTEKEFTRREVWAFLNRKQREEVLAAFADKNLMGDERGTEKKGLLKEIEKISAKYNEVIDEMNRYLDDGLDSEFVRE